MLGSAFAIPCTTNPSPLLSRWRCVFSASVGLGLVLAVLGFVGRLRSGEALVLWTRAIVLPSAIIAIPPGTHVHICNLMMARLGARREHVRVDVLEVTLSLEVHYRGFPDIYLHLWARSMISPISSTTVSARLLDVYIRVLASRTVPAIIGTNQSQLVDARRRLTLSALSDLLG